MATAPPPTVQDVTWQKECIYLNHTFICSYLSKEISGGHWRVLSALDNIQTSQGSRSPPLSPVPKILATLPAYQTFESSQPPYSCTNFFTRGFEAKLAQGKLFFHSEFKVKIWFRETLLPPGPSHRDCHIVWPCMSEFKVIIPNKRTPRPCQSKLQIPIKYQLSANNNFVNLY